MGTENFKRPINAPGHVRFKDVTLTAAQVNALFATPRTLLPAPKGGWANIFEGAHVYKGTGTAYTIGAAGNIVISYTDAAGLAVGELGQVGFSDQATAQTRWIQPHRAASGNSAIVPVSAAIVIHQLVANMADGTSPFKLRVFYRQLPMVL